MNFFNILKINLKSNCFSLRQNNNISIIQNCLLSIISSTSNGGAI